MNKTIQATWMRGGTSKCWVFDAEELDALEASRDEVLLRLFGSPDPRQIDGVGGATSTTSKAVILAKSKVPNVDVEYTFAQVGITEATVDWGSNCGNCSAVVAPYALDRGWVQPSGDETFVRVLNTNTNQIIVERVPTPSGVWTAAEDTFIPGVSFPGVAVSLGFENPAGGTTGKLLPTGQARQVLDVAGYGSTEVTLLDAGAPLVILSQESANLGGVAYEQWSVEALSELERLDAIRRAGAVALGLASRSEEAARAIPKLAIVGPVEAGSTADLNVMMLSMGNPHPALAITGSIGLTVAAATKGSVPAEFVTRDVTEGVHFKTPAGELSTWRKQIDGQDVVGAVRTARRIGSAHLDLPVSLHHNVQPAQQRDVTYITEAEGEGALLPVESEAEPDLPKPSRRTVLASVGLFGLLGISTSIFGQGLLNPPATTEDGDYAGETLKILIPLAEGGGTDTWARFIGSELVHKIPGTPGFAPTNESGGEGITGSNRFITSAKTDGTELLVSTATTVVPWILQRKAVKYSFDRLTPILVNGTGGVIYARAAAGVKGISDLRNRRKPLVFGGISATGLDLTTLVAFDLLEAETTATFGFEGRGPVNLALQRGEVDIDYTTTSSYGSAVKGIAKEGKAIVLMSFGQLDSAKNVVRDPNFPDVPTVVEAYEELHGKKPEGPKFEAYKTMLGLTYTYQKGLWAPHDSPDKAVQLLRKSADALSKDQAFNAKAKEVLGGYPLVADANLSQRISEAYVVTDETKSYVLSLLKNTYGIEVH